MMASQTFPPWSQPALSQNNGSRVPSVVSFRSASNAAANDPLQPLRAMADRVGKEVEKFAERVDHWHTHGNESQKAKYQTTVKMVGKFRDLAKSNVDELQKQNASENRGELDKSVRRRIQTMGPDTSSGRSKTSGLFSQSVVSSIEGSSTPASSDVQELRHWEAELATWELLSLVIAHYHPEPGTDVAGEKAKQLAAAGGQSKYSPKSEVWERFILADDVAREKKLVLEWLQQTARNTESDIESIVDQWAAASGKDTNTWTSGWLDTKAAIKQAKRVESSDKPLDPTYHLKSNRIIVPLVTRLDPDAPFRQQRALEESDEYYENALWSICYEMLRRGEPWEKVDDWLKERNEAWRAVSLGISQDSQPKGAPNLSGNDLGYRYRRICNLAARGARIPYEGAVYALLSGEIDRIHAACRSWDDHLYAYYNALLLFKFDHNTLQDPARVPVKMGPDTFVFENVMSNFSDWNTTNKEVIELLMKNKATSAQAKSPTKLIQGALISRNVEELLHKVGVAVADMLQNDSRLNLLMIDPDSNTEDPQPKMATQVRAVSAEDFHRTLVSSHHTLRVLVHVYIALGRGLGEIKLENDGKGFAINNVVTFYIEFLRITKRLQLIPLYAAQLGDHGASHCMARVLLDIKNNEEQKRCMNLMEQYRIDSTAAIKMSAALQLQATGYVDGITLETINPISTFKLLQASPDQDGYLWPGKRIMRQFSGSDISAQEDAAIESLMWYNHLEHDVECTFRDLNIALSAFLRNGRIGAAEKLATEMSVEALSLTKTAAICGYAFDFTAAGAEEQDERQVGDIMSASLRSSGHESIRPSEIPNKEEHARSVQYLRQASQKYYNLVQIVRVITLFRQWRAEEDKLIQLRISPGKISMARVKQLTGEIEALFEQIFDPAEEPSEEVWGLYKTYVPELVIGYLSVLQAGAFFIHRDSITKAMDVATIVADSDRVWLQRLFMETGRMSEFVETLANVSRAMLRLDEAGEAKTKSKKRGSRGESLRIWNLNTVN